MDKVKIKGAVFWRIMESMEGFTRLVRLFCYQRRVIIQAQQIDGPSKSFVEIKLTCDEHLQKDWDVDVPVFMRWDTRELNYKLRSVEKDDDDLIIFGYDEFETNTIFFIKCPKGICKCSFKISPVKPFDLSQPSILPEEVIKFNPTVSIDATVFSEACTRFGDKGADSVVVAMRNNTTLEFSANEDKMTLDVKINGFIKPVEYKISRKCFSKAVKAGEVVTISLGSDNVVVKYTLGQANYIKFYLGPRCSDDNEEDDGLCYDDDVIKSSWADDNEEDDKKEEDALCYDDDFISSCSDNEKDDGLWDDDDFIKSSCIDDNEEDDGRCYDDDSMKSSCIDDNEEDHPESVLPDFEGLEAFYKDHPEFINEDDAGELLFLDMCAFFDKSK